MIKTKLVLIEGLPCSGKSTLSVHLEKAFVAKGVPAKSHHENSEDHPIVIDYGAPYSVEVGERYLEQWIGFVERKRDSDQVDLIDNRFWINVGVFIIYSGFSVEDFFQVNRRTVETLQPLNPVLINFRHSSTDDGIQRAQEVRGEEWMNSILKRDLAYPWFRERGISDFEGYLEFWRFWREVTEKLWNQCPFRKLELVDAHRDWAGNYDRVFEVLDRNKAY